MQNKINGGVGVSRRRRRALERLEKSKAQRISEGQEPSNPSILRIDREIEILKSRI